MEDEVYCPKTKTLDLGKRRVTDLKTNRRIMMPDPRPAKEEAVLMVRRERIMQETENYIREKCNSKGEIKESNMTSYS